MADFKNITLVTEHAKVTMSIKHTTRVKMNGHCLFLRKLWNKNSNLVRFRNFFLWQGRYLNYTKS